MNKTKTAIIVPCYNEELRLQKDKFIVFANQNSDIDLWFINDGSKDGTLNLLHEIAKANQDRIFVYDMPRNGGKAEAIRQGVLMLSKDSRYSYIGFLDADLSAPLAEILPLNEVIIQQQLLIVAGARVKLVGRHIFRSPVRHYMGRVFATYYDTLLKLRNYDTQCGLKIFESKFAAKLYEQPFVSNWFFDIELFLRARIAIGKEQYGVRIAEVPLTEWREVKGSKLKITDFAKAPFEVLKIYLKYKNKEQ